MSNDRPTNATHTDTECTGPAHVHRSGYRSGRGADSYVSTHLAPTGRVFAVRDNDPDPDRATALDVWCMPLPSGTDTDGRIHAERPLPETTDDDEVEERPTCLDASEECAGAVEYRMPLSDSGKPFPRCDHHWHVRLDTQDRLRHDYGVDSSPGVVPSDFDPSYAGENWDED